MTQTKQVEIALLTEHFGWTPISFIDETINTINDLLNRLVDTIEEGLKSADPGPTLGFSAKASEEGRIVDTDEDGREIFGEEVSREIEEGVHKLETLLESTVDKNFDKWEIYVLRNCLSLGKEAESLMGWIRLRGYEDLYPPPISNSTASSKDSEKPPAAPTPESLMALRRKLQETQSLHAALLEEKRRNAAILSQLRALTSDTSPSLLKQESADETIPPTNLSFLTSSGNLKSASTLPTSTAFPITQLPHLKRLLDQLRPSISSLPSPSTSSETSVRAAERRAYVERQTKKLLERRGVDTSEGLGMSSTGSTGLGLGQKTGHDELKALESVVAILGAQKSDVNEQVGNRGEQDSDVTMGGA